MKGQATIVFSLSVLLVLAIVALAMLALLPGMIEAIEDVAQSSSYVSSAPTYVPESNVPAVAADEYIDPSIVNDDVPPMEAEEVETWLADEEAASIERRYGLSFVQMTLYDVEQSGAVLFLPEDVIASKHANEKHGYDAKKARSIFKEYKCKDGRYEEWWTPKHGGRKLFLCFMPDGNIAAWVIRAASAQEVLKRAKEITAFLVNQGGFYSNINSWMEQVQGAVP